MLREAAGEGSQDHQAYAPQGHAEEKDIERAVDVAKRQRPKPEANASFNPLPDEVMG